MSYDKSHSQTSIDDLVYGDGVDSRVLASLYVEQWFSSNPQKRTISKDDAVSILACSLRHCAAVSISDKKKTRGLMRMYQRRYYKLCEILKSKKMPIPKWHREYLT